MSGKRHTFMAQSSSNCKQYRQNEHKLNKHKMKAKHNHIVQTYISVLKQSL